MFNQHDVKRDSCMLHGPLAHHGYDWWWHSFTAQDAETGEDKPFFIEFFVCNPALAEDMPAKSIIPAAMRIIKNFFMIFGIKNYVIVTQPIQLGGSDVFDNYKVIRFKNAPLFFSKVLKKAFIYPI